MAFAKNDFLGTAWRAQGLKYILLPDGMVASSFISRKQQHKTGEKTRSNVSEQSISIPARSPLAEKVTPHIWRPTPRNQWPDSWQKILAKTNSGKLAWTYWALGRDLNSASNLNNDELNAKNQRSALLRQFLLDLNYGKGTHTFWPCNLPKQDNPADLEFNADMFWSGLKLLGCRGTIIMGSEAAYPLLEVNYLKPMVQKKMNGQFIWILWDINHLATSANDYARALNFLKHGLSILNLN